ncbi:glycosyltransferase family 4 protein [Winogradskyella forsetii]|uniref:glycosyltransferase family 4 protein n=1 Tax=Winogradskyella forsetii TaxID=2686077 RepID=UPI0015C0FB91|nr:glycosyltransferase family 4 protein [Winogradskyella forsetii]
MKILILYGYNQSLLSEFFQELSGKLSADGHEVINFYFKREKTSFMQNGVTVYGEIRKSLWANYRSIYSVIKQTKPDVVISNFSYINPSILFGKLLGVSHNIAWFHTAFGHTKPNQLKVWNKSLFLKMADLVLTNSELLEKEMHTVYKVSEQKTSRLPFWTNIANYASKTVTPYIKKKESIINIGCPGRLLEDKNHTLVIKALSELKKSSKQTIRLYIPGNGNYKPQLEELINNLGLEQDVIFMGRLNVKQMASFYQAMDIVVLPSFHEAFGLVFIESIAMGTPVLVSKSFGALCFIDSEKFPIQDFCFNPEAIQELINKLVPYIKRQGLPKDYFKRMYKETFEKQLIYNQIKSLVLNKKQH